jgi:hypothetical protein
MATIEGGSIELELRHDPMDTGCPNRSRSWRLYATVINGRLLMPQVGACVECGCDLMVVTDIRVELGKVRAQQKHGLS